MADQCSVHGWLGGGRLTLLHSDIHAYLAEVEAVPIAIITFRAANAAIGHLVLEPVA